MTKMPPDDILESLYKLRIRESAQLKTMLELHDKEIHHKISIPNNQKLKTMVKKFDARHGKMESGAVVKSRKGRIGVAGGKRYLLQVERQKASVRKETNAVCGMRVAIVPKNQTTMPPHFPSQPYDEVEVCRGREVSEAKITTGPFFEVQILFESYQYANVL